ncbi:MAG: hypothetical protein SGI88_08010 [Candidatus Hydrogenedentes bacterium]|nr:hypothetical protein [Candidatus Hydrogenedentota bacterium]
MNRRVFISRIGIAFGAFAIPQGVLARPIDDRWRAARDLITSGVVGSVRSASAILSVSGAPRIMRALPGNSESAPAEVCEILQAFMYAVGDNHVARLTTDFSTGNFTMTCRLHSGAHIAIARVSRPSTTPPSIRCAKGTVHIHPDRMDLEVDGRWYAPRDLNTGTARS